MSLVLRHTSFGERIQSILCIISFLLLREVNTESGEDVSSGDDEPIPDEVGNLDTVDDDVIYSRIVLCTIIFLVTLGPVLTYFFAFSYSSQNGFLRITSRFYWVLFWVAVPFAIGCFCDALQSSLKDSVHHSFISTDIYAIFLDHHSH